MDDLPHLLDGAPVDWVPLERSRALQRLHVSSLPHAVADSGRYLHGVPLPKPERNDMNISGAWDMLIQAHEQMRDCLQNLTNYWRRTPRRRLGFSTSAAERSAMAGELLCKAVLSLRGVEPKRSHSVMQLCGVIEAAFPRDPLVPLLRECEGTPAEAHVNGHTDRFDQRDGHRFRNPLGERPAGVRVGGGSRVRCFHP
ncbi:MAG: hypothetical protein OXN89_12290 [Bryobacterales bacterium]|nr:hypothetical protein [Bryobacterales bacterium]